MISRDKSNDTNNPKGFLMVMANPTDLGHGKICLYLTESD